MTNSTPPTTRHPSTGRPRDDGRQHRPWRSPDRGRPRRRRACGCRAWDDRLRSAEEGQPLLVLVHGTWAGHSGRLMAAASRAELGGAVLLEHCWSGRNRHRDRLDAGKELRERLRELSDRRPSSPISVVAHSHGGNVALYALDESTPAGEVLRHVRLVTLSTPFLNARPRRMPTDVTWYVATAAFSAVVFGVFAVLTGSVVLRAVLGLPLSITANLSTEALSLSPADASWPNVAVGIAFILLGMLLTYAPIASVASAVRYFGRTDAPRRWSAYRADSISSEAARLTANDLSPGRHLALHPRDDEPSAVLAISALGSWISWRVLEWARMMRLALVTASAIAVALLLDLLHPASDAVTIFLVLTAATAVNLVFATGVVAIGAVWLSNVAFGLDGMWGSLAIRFTSDVVPGNNATLSVIDAPVAEWVSGSTVHGMYRWEATWTSVAGFIDTGHRDR